MSYINLLVTLTCVPQSNYRIQNPQDQIFHERPPWCNVLK